MKLVVTKVTKEVDAIDVSTVNDYQRTVPGRPTIKVQVELVLEDDQMIAVTPENLIGTVWRAV